MQSWTLGCNIKRDSIVLDHFVATSITSDIAGSMLLKLLIIVLIDLVYFTHRKDTGRGLKPPIIQSTYFHNEAV
jgi:hypothetical protein